MRSLRIWTAGAASTIVLAFGSPYGLVAQSDMPSAEEVREALETLRRFERALTERPADRHRIDDHGLHRLDQPGEPLRTPTAGGIPSPQTVAAPGSFSLALDGDLDIGGAVFQGEVPFVHADGGEIHANTAVGLNALVSATPGTPTATSGANNTALGHSALRNSTTAFENLAAGDGSLYTNTIGFRNTALGSRALYSNQDGTGNIAVGWHSLYSHPDGSSNIAIGAPAMTSAISGDFNIAIGTSSLASNDADSNVAIGDQALNSNTTGAENVAIGRDAALGQTTGKQNVAIGYRAGRYWSTGNYNVAIGYGAEGATAETRTIRIGGMDNQITTYIEGIRGAASGHANGFDQSVCIDFNEQLGPCTPSTARLKTDVRPMDNLSTEVGALRPVTFRYRPPASEETDGRPLHYGLIAEEVAAIFPTLVSYDDEGQPHTVRYELLTPLLLSELQRQRGALERRDEGMERLRAQMADLTQRLDQMKR